MSKVLMDRYLKLQTIRTATLNALTVDSKGFDADAAMRDQGLADGDPSEFNKNVAEAIAGQLQKFKMNNSNVQFTSTAVSLTVWSCKTI